MNPATENRSTLKLSVQLPMLSVALLTEGLLVTRGARAKATATRPRAEVFTVNFSAMQLELVRTPERGRHVEFTVQEMQVDMRHPYEEVILASTSRPFLTFALKQDDITMLDVHIRDAQVSVGQMEFCLTHEVWEQVASLAQELTPGAQGRAVDDVLIAAGMPFHLCSGPPIPSSKLVVWSLHVGRTKANVWCTVYLPHAHYIPETLRRMIALVSFGTVILDVKGAEVKVPAEQVFSNSRPGEGTFGAVSSAALRHYLPHLKACWQSLLKDSNVFLAGLVSRHLWAPKRRIVSQVMPSVCVLGRDGELFVSQLQGEGHLPGCVRQSSRPL